ncbi:unnamed protein product [Caenorhabditis brenneri]
MEAPEQVLFLAARRGFYTDGISFLMIVGLSPHEDKSYRITEQKLTDKGIRLGSFLLGTVVSSDEVRNLQLTNYQLEVSVEGNTASVTLQSVEAVTTSNGKIGFKTKPFGIVNSVDKKIQRGYHNIKITAESVPGEQKCLLRRWCNSFRKGSLSSSKKASQYWAEVITNSNSDEDQNAYANYPMPLPRSVSLATNNTTASSNQYDKISSRSSMNSRHPQKSTHQDLTKTLSKSSDSITVADLISKLPNLKPPAPPPRTVEEEIKSAVVPKNENKITGEGFSVRVPENPKRNMTAFVVHVAENKETKSKLHFIWICDIQEESVIRDPVYDLQIGHFFEGEFEKMKYGRWEFKNYIKEVEGLIEGNINQICGRIELIVPINRYEQQSDSSEFPIVHADYLGEIKDKKNRLPANCAGRKILVNRQRNKETDKFEWIVVKLIRD